MSKHTPKPWEYMESSIVGPKLDDKETWLRPVVARFATGVSLANLNLMLAAPELLDALRGMLALDEEHHQRGHCDDDVCTEVRKARAAIAKATGEHK